MLSTESFRKAEINQIKTEIGKAAKSKAEILKAESRN
jgi:hypothetical protein